jgi:predicted O-methyltransferase YrrM
MKFKKQMGSYMPVLLNLLYKTTGPVLELGTGIFSTPVMHWACFDKKRPLISYENNPDYFKLNEQYNYDFHKIYFINDWNSIDIEKTWDVVLIDCAPALSRKDVAKKLSNYAQYIILHDTWWKEESHFHYKEIFPLFKYKFDYFKEKPAYTSVLSNFIDLTHCME